MTFDQLPTWDALLKRIMFKQLGDVQGLRILDFGSGEGFTADYFAANNQVLAVEIDPQAVARRSQEHAYRQLTGSLEMLTDLPDASFDMVLCHNVLEYMEERPEAIRAFHRLLKPGGRLSLCKHNRAGRIMQMAVLLNAFDRANALLDGHDSVAAQYGAIRYYEDSDPISWCPGLRLERVQGIRCFWDLQQQQECQRDPAWQEQMIALEMRVSELPAFRDIAFFHHLTLIREDSEA